MSASTAIQAAVDLMKLKFDNNENYRAELEKGSTEGVRKLVSYYRDVPVS